METGLSPLAAEEARLASQKELEEERAARAAATAEAAAARDAATAAGAQTPFRGVLFPPARQDRRLHFPRAAQGPG